MERLDQVNFNGLTLLFLVRKGLNLPANQPVPFSAVTGAGKKDLWKIIKESLLYRDEEEEGGEDEDEDEDEGGLDPPFLEDPEEEPR